MKPEFLKLMALTGNLERKHAYMAALTLSNRAYELFGIYVGLFGGKNIPRFLRLVAAAWEEKPSKFDLTPTGLAIIKAWWAAYGIAGRGPNGFEVLAKPTLLEIKTQYALAYKKRAANRSHEETQMGRRLGTREANTSRSDFSKNAWEGQTAVSVRTTDSHLRVVRHCFDSGQRSCCRTGKKCGRTGACC